MNWLGDALRAKLAQRQSELDGEVVALILHPPPERIVRTDNLHDGEALEIPGEQFTDGLPRLVVSRGQYLHPQTVERYT